MKQFLVFSITLLISLSSLATSMSDIDLMTREEVSNFVLTTHDAEVSLEDVSVMGFVSKEGCNLAVGASVRYYLNEWTTSQCVVCFSSSGKQGFTPSSTSCELKKPSFKPGFFSSSIKQQCLVILLTFTRG